MEKKILIFTGHYLPGWKAGGILRSMVNLASSLGGEFQLHFCVLDRDLGDKYPYRYITANTWINEGAVRIYYSKKYSFQKILKITAQIQPDLVYLNSFFYSACIKYIVLKKLGFFFSIPILLAPRGEFADGSFHQKKANKQNFINVFSNLGLLKNLNWRASGEMEEKDILSKIQDNPKVFIASDISDEVQIICKSQTKKSSVLKIIFLSRIVPEKNLLFVLNILSQLENPAVLDIFGTAENATYYDALRKAAELPKHISWNFHEALPHERVHQRLSEYDLLFLPSLGESFGHVIAESLAAGTPVLTSNLTPWYFEEDDPEGWTLSLSKPENFLDKIVYLQSLSASERSAIKMKILNRNLIKKNRMESISDHRRMFEQIITLK